MQYSEEQIWDALERTHMKECVSKGERGALLESQGGRHINAMVAPRPAWAAICQPGLSLLQDLWGGAL